MVNNLELEVELEADKGFFEGGYRWRRIRHPDGSEVSIQVPLTAEDFLNPQEGDVLPQNTFHEIVTVALRNMLRLYYKGQPHMAVFHDLIMNWGVPGLKNPSPDIAVVPNVRDRDRKRSTFNAKREGTKPILVIEVVSPSYRREDLIDKVDIYEQAGVEEYVILEEKEQRGQTINLITGYRLINDRYRPILLEDDGRMPLNSVGLFISLENGKVVLEELESGRRLLDIEEIETARVELQAEVEALRAELVRLKGGD